MSHGSAPHAGPCRPQAAVRRLGRSDPEQLPRRRCWGLVVVVLATVVAAALLPLAEAQSSWWPFGDGGAAERRAEAEHRAVVAVLEAAHMWTPDEPWEPRLPGAPPVQRHDPCTWPGVMCVGSPQLQAALTLPQSDPSLPGRRREAALYAGHANASRVAPEPPPLACPAGCRVRGLRLLPLRWTAPGDTPAQARVSAAVCRLQCLEVLHVVGSAVGGVLPACLGALAALRVLGVAGTQMGGSPAALVATMPRLEALSLPNNGFTGPLPRPAAGAPLVAMVLDHNDFEEEDVAAYIAAASTASPWSLRVVSLAGNARVRGTLDTTHALADFCARLFPLMPLSHDTLWVAAPEATRASEQVGVMLAGTAVVGPAAAVASSGAPEPASGNWALATCLERHFHWGLTWPALAALHRQGSNGAHPLVVPHPLVALALPGAPSGGESLLSRAFPESYAQLWERMLGHQGAPSARAAPPRTSPSWPPLPTPVVATPLEPPGPTGSWRPAAVESPHDPPPRLAVRRGRGARATPTAAQAVAPGPDHTTRAPAALQAHGPWLWCTWQPRVVLGGPLSEGPARRLEHRPPEHTAPESPAQGCAFLHPHLLVHRLVRGTPDAEQVWIKASVSLLLLPTGWAPAARRLAAAGHLALYVARSLDERRLVRLALTEPPPPNPAQSALGELTLASAWRVVGGVWADPRPASAVAYLALEVPVPRLLFWCPLSDLPPGTGHAATSCHATDWGQVAQTIRPPAPELAAVPTPGRVLPSQ